jgi:hypothetical protein
MIKKILCLLFAGVVLSTAAQTSVTPAIPRDENMERQIEAQLKKMTLDEKVGQMCQLAIDVLQKRSNPFAGMDVRNITVEDLKRILRRRAARSGRACAPRRPGGSRDHRATEPQSRPGRARVARVAG